MKLFIWLSAGNRCTVLFVLIRRQRYRTFFFFFWSGRDTESQTLSCPDNQVPRRWPGNQNTGRNMTARVIENLNAKYFAFSSWLARGSKRTVYIITVHMWGKERLLLVVSFYFHNQPVCFSPRHLFRPVRIIFCVKRNGGIKNRPVYIQNNIYRAIFIPSIPRTIFSDFDFCFVRFSIVNPVASRRSQ